jgi:thiamine transporter ThiT
MWIITLLEKGTGYLTSYPENLLSFILTIFGLLALAIYTAYFTKKSSGAETLQELNLKIVGVIIIALGMYFLWNYLTWIFFGGDYLWSDWYAWFLGHNLDLWMLSLPLLGLPLLFTDKPREKIVQNMPDIPRA